MNEKLVNTMEGGGVDTTVIDSRQHKIGLMATHNCTIAAYGTGMTSFYAFSL